MSLLISFLVVAALLAGILLIAIPLMIRRNGRQPEAERYWTDPSMRR